VYREIEKQKRPNSKKVGIKQKNELTRATQRLRKGGWIKREKEQSQKKSAMREEKCKKRATYKRKKKSRSEIDPIRGNSPGQEDSAHRAASPP